MDYRRRSVWQSESQSLVLIIIIAIPYIGIRTDVDLSFACVLLLFVLELVECYGMHYVVPELLDAAGCCWILLDDNVRMIMLELSILQVS